ncbi:NAD(P)-dependent oxidoreductase [Nocardioides sp. Bht2]|uniref:NAD(P)-dependent oxidoreductase n=1 Tax=Nocardioides sp. Bht2 TaxID=3392297 RepID=UPI0039B5164B
MTVEVPLRVGFVGLGDIGKPMALRLAGAANVELTVFDLEPAPLVELAATGAGVAASVAALAEVEVVCVMVRNDDQVRSVLTELLAAIEAADGAAVRAVVVHSTVAPTTPAELAASAASAGIAIVDAPVSGGAMGANAGTLAIMAGGGDEAFDLVRPVLAAMASKVVHAGPLGAGTKFKLARNLMHFVAFTAATEAQRLAEAAGLDLLALGDVVRHTDAVTGGPGAIMHRPTSAPIPADDFWFDVFAHVRALGEKDLRFAVELADELGVETPLARIALDRFGTGLGLPADPAERP